jgi:hypothetical protein
MLVLMGGVLKKKPVELGPDSWYIDDKPAFFLYDRLADVGLSRFEGKHIQIAIQEINPSEGDYNGKENDKEDN